MTNTVLIGQILLSPDELPLGETTFGLNELIPIKYFVLQSPHHRIPQFLLKLTPLFFFQVIGKFSIRLVPNMTPETVKEQVFKYIKELHEKRGSPNTLK